MYHDLPRPASFWSFLLAVDEDLAEETRKQGCSCGGRLHCANYPRKPRGAGLKLTEFQRLRVSFCCDRDGCRKRATPRSVRFLGRKVYLAANCHPRQRHAAGAQPAAGQRALQTLRRR